MPATWTDDRVDTLTRLWRDGLSASQIARDLGGVTRNAVIGKVHRLGLSGRATPHVPGARHSEPRGERRYRRPQIAAQAVRPAGVTPAAVPSVEPVPDTGLATTLSVRWSQCRWPFGDPLADGFRLCGRGRARGAYCAAHGALAYRPTERNHLMKLAGLRPPASTAV